MREAGGRRGRLEAGRTQAGGRLEGVGMTMGMWVTRIICNAKTAACGGKAWAGWKQSGLAWEEGFEASWRWALAP